MKLLWFGVSDFTVGLREGGREGGRAGRRVWEGGKLKDGRANCRLPERAVQYT